MNNKIIAAFVVYGLLGLLTFGYSYNADYRLPRSDFSTAEEVNFAGASIAGMGWPLYWVIVAFKPMRPADTTATAK